MTRERGETIGAAFFGQADDGEALQHLRTLLNTVDDGVYQVDAEGRFVAVNEVIVELTGYSRETLIGEHVSIVLDRHDWRRIEREIATQLATGDHATQSFELTVHTAGGGTIPCDVRLNLLVEDGEFRGSVGVARDISERKRAEEIIEERERRRRRERELEQYRALTEAANDVIVTIDDGGTIQTVNPAAESVFGYRPDELVGEPLTVILPGRHEDVPSRYGDAGDPSPDREHVELPGRHADGSEVPLAISFSEVEYEDERYYTGILRDVSERKARERELEETERRHETLVENFPNGAVALVDESLEYQTVLGDPLAAGDVGAEELEGKAVREPIPPALAEELVPRYRAAIDGESSTFEFAVDDQVYEFQTVPVRDDDGEVLAALGMSQDVTERTERECELERRARQQRAVAELGQYALEVDDLDALMQAVTEQVAEALDSEYCTVLDLDRAQRTLTLRQGVGWDEAVVGEATVDADGDSQVGFTLRSEEPVVVRDLGSEARFSEPALPSAGDVASGVSTVIGPIDAPWGILGVHDTEPRAFTEEDVNFVQSVANVLAEAIERGQFRAERERFIEELEASNERLEQFAYAASHDLREPLRMVSSYLRMIEDRYADELDADGREFIDYAVDGADRMREMIDGLLEYSRIQTRGDAFGPVDLERVVTDVRADLQVKIEESDAHVTTGELPVVEGDAGQLRQVFQNLLENAIEYSGDGPPRIHVSAEREGDRHMIAVEDDGVGIDPADADRVFEVFQRLHARDEHPGTGIGLALVKRIVERHGGEVWVDSEPGEGATFRFTLPAVEP